MTENFEEEGDQLRYESELQAPKDIYESSIRAQRASLTAMLEELIDEIIDERKSLDHEFEVKSSKHFEMNMREFVSACWASALDHMFKRSSRCLN